jgi:protein O-GlcNAc transferase
MTASEIVSRAIDDHREGRLVEAEAGYRAALAIEPNDFDSLHLVGYIYFQRGDHRQAIEWMCRAVEQEPAAFPAHANLGRAYLAVDDFDRARTSFETALRLNPDLALAHECLGVVLQRQGHTEAAVTHFQRVAVLQPDSAEAHNNLGVALHERGQFDHAYAAYKRALELDPKLAGAALNLAEVMRLQGKHAEAVEFCRRVVALQPGTADAHYRLGIALHANGSGAEAVGSLREALVIDPDYVEARWALTMAELPQVFTTGETAEETRRNFARSLAELDAWFAGPRVNRGYNAVGSQQPFYLAYHAGNHVELLSRYGDLCARLLGQWQSDQHVPATAKRRAAPLRLAIVSGHIFDHSVWTAITRGFCEQLDPRQVSIHIFYAGVAEDRETAAARTTAASFVKGQMPLRQWVDAIRLAEPDAILYPAIGMDQMTTRLAALRIAPTQLVAWGHPITTGLPTIDGYLSASAFEPDNAQDHYREKLVALPNLGCCYRALGVVPRPTDIAALAPDANSPVVLCAGTPYKYQPNHDAIYVAIARRLGRVRLVFFEDTAIQVTRTLWDRLERAFETAGLDPRQYLILAPRLERAAFFGLMQQADLMLDTIGFSGFNTVMQAMECGLPVVGYEGRYMRGRFASGILQRVGLNELVASTESEFTDLAVRICSDGQYRRHLRTRLQQSRHMLFDDQSPVRALEAALLQFSQRPVRPA